MNNHPTVTQEYESRVTKNLSIGIGEGGITSVVTAILISHVTEGVNR